MKNVMPRSYKAEDTGFSIILSPVFPKGARNTRGSGKVRNALRDAAVAAVGIDSTKNATDYTKAEKGQLERRLNFLSDGSIQVIKGGEEAALAMRIAEADENYLALFGGAEDTPDDYARNLPNKAAISAVARAIKGLKNREATDEETVKFVRDQIIPDLITELQKLAERSDASLLAVKSDSQAAKLSNLEASLSEPEEEGEGEE